MAADLDSVLNDLKNNKYAPVYFLQGDEPFFIDQVANFIEENALDEASKGFNQMVMYGKDVSIQEVINNARRFPMMSERQVVIVKEAQNISDISKERGAKLLKDYLANPLPSTILVFAYKYKKVDQRTAIGKEIAAKAVFIDTKKLYDNQVPDWIRKYVKSIGLGINDDAAYLIANFIGNNLERVSNEVKKILINLKKDEKEITAAHVRKYIGFSKDFNVFELNKALAYRNVLKVNSIINYFAANPKENPAIMVIAVLYNFFSRLLIIHAMPDKSEKGISSKFRIPFFAAKEYQSAVSIYSRPKTEAIIAYLRNADMQAKGINANAMEDGEILKELMYRIMH